jgi:NADPH:quinone reductase-like Zn-dependent oxidoreductase
MKAIVQDSYGSADVLELRDIDQPEVKDGEVLVRVRAAAIHAGDLLLMTGRPYLMRLAFGLRRPRKRIPGFDVAGHVEAVGRNVTRFRPGDEVFGECPGALAEYVSTSENKLAAKPAGLTFEQAAAVPTSGVTALRGLRDAGRLRPGQRVLIIGASGGVGTFAVQIAAAMGAEVTGVCGPGNVDLVRSLGAGQVIDYTRQDCAQGTERYDLILDNVASHSLSACRRALTPRGTLIPNNGTSGGRWTGTLGRILAAHAMSLFVRQRLRPYLALIRAEDLAALTDLIEAGKVTPVLDRTYRLDEAPEAIRYVGRGHARGKVVITAL